MTNFNISSKNTRLITSFALSLLAALALSLSLSSLAHADPTAPTIVTESAYSITDTSALLDVCANANGADTTIDFSYGSSLTYGTDAPSESGPISGESNTTECEGAAITGLTPGTVYYFEATATNSEGSVTSSNGTFQTTPGELPASSTVTGGSSVAGSFSQGNTAEYLSPSDTAAFDPNYEDVAQTVTTTETISNLSVNVTDSSSSDMVRTGLLVNQVASGQSCIATGTTTCSDTSDTITVHPGDQLAFQVQDNGSLFGFPGTDNVSVTYSYDVDTLAAPQVANVDVNPLTPTSATVGAQINTHGTDGLYQIEYGESNTYGDVSPDVIRDLGELDGTTVSENLSNLAPDTTYHYAIVATNAGGTTTTPDQTFTTPALAPAVSLSTSMLAFGSSVFEDSPTTKTVTITNTGTAALVFGSGAATIQDASAANTFSVSSDSCSGQAVEQEASCTIGVTFNPTATGAQSATLQLADDSADSPQTVALTGTVTAAVSTGGGNTGGSDGGDGNTGGGANTGGGSSVNTGPPSTGPGQAPQCPSASTYISRRVTIKSETLSKGVLTIKGHVTRASQKHLSLVLLYGGCGKYATVHARSVSINHKTGAFTVRIAEKSGNKTSGYRVSVK